jgi:hypothetical protein
MSNEAIATEQGAASTATAVPHTRRSYGIRELRASGSRRLATSAATTLARGTAATGHEPLDLADPLCHDYLLREKGLLY